MIASEIKKIQKSLNGKIDQVIQNYPFASGGGLYRQYYVNKMIGIIEKIIDSIIYDREEIYIDKEEDPYYVLRPFLRENGFTILEEGSRCRISW